VSIVWQGQLVKRVRSSTEADSANEMEAAVPPPKKRQRQMTVGSPKGQDSGARLDSLCCAKGVVHGSKPPPVDAEDPEYTVEFVRVCYIRKR
jgi:hypothetical protein